jgi:[protein-PII] uridylyltransferase
VIATPTPSERRRQRSAAADERLRALWDDATRAVGCSGAGAALVAVGGYGRGELSPRSDLDVVLLVADGLDRTLVAELAEKVWYPLWDANVALDHAVRSERELRGAADDDFRVALGLLDMRHLAGDATLTLSSRAIVLADWRRSAKGRLPVVAAATRDRWQRVGDLGHATTPDLKDAHGGLRDAVLLRGLLATWLIDVPSAELARLHRDLLAIRDALQETTGRATDRLVADYAADVAARLALRDADVLRTEIVSLGRGIGHLASVALRNVDWMLTPAPSGSSRRPVLDVLGPGVGAYRGEIVLTARARPSENVLLGLRAAEAAATRGLVLTDAAAARLGRELPAMPTPWPAEGRSMFARTLAAGPSLVDVWESLDQYGVVDVLLPEWSSVRHLPPQSAVHRFTVDRHLVQTCVEAASLVHRVERPDLLVVAALLHDIGKGLEGDHCELGEPIAAAIAARVGFDAHDADVVGRLVRHHLLLIDAATSCDPDDPDTARVVADAVGDVPTLDLLSALTEADALATGPQAWTPWRKQLVDAVADQTRRHLHLGGGVSRESPGSPRPAGSSSACRRPAHNARS